MQEDAYKRIRTFTASGDEASDIYALNSLLEDLTDWTSREDVRRALFMIFERNPNADLGSPGPLVHVLEDSPIDAHVELLAESIRRRATVMTTWMAERCLRSDLTWRNRELLLNALKDAQADELDPDTKSSIEEALGEYGTSDPR